MDDDLLREFEGPSSVTAADRARRRRLGAAAAIAALAFVGIGQLATGALYTNTASGSTNTFTTGTVNITATNPIAVLPAGNMAPGDTAFGPINVTNGGSLQYRYAVTASADNLDGKDLRSQLQVSVFALPAASCNAAGVAAQTPLGGPAAINAAAPASQAVFGDVTQGQQAGDQVMAAGASQTLCVEANLPLATSNAYQGASTVLTFNFVAEQTANNP